MKLYKDILRVWRVTRKPNKKEYTSTLKIVVIGFLLIGILGFAIQMMWEFGLKNLF